MHRQYRRSQRSRGWINKLKLERITGDAELAAVEAHADVRNGCTSHDAQTAVALNSASSPELQAMLFANFLEETHDGSSPA